MSPKYSLDQCAPSDCCTALNAYYFYRAPTAQSWTVQRPQLQQCQMAAHVGAGILLEVSTGESLLPYPRETAASRSGSSRLYTHVWIDAKMRKTILGALLGRGFRIWQHRLPLSLPLSWDQSSPSSTPKSLTSGQCYWSADWPFVWFWSPALTDTHPAPVFPPPTVPKMCFMAHSQHLEVAVHTYL